MSEHLNFSPIPRYPDPVPTEHMKTLAIRITEKQRAYTDRIVKATNAQSIGASVRLLITSELNALTAGDRTPADYIPTADPKLYTVGIKLSKADRQALKELRSYYDAVSISDAVCYLLNRVIRELEKDGE